MERGGDSITIHINHENEIIVRYSQNNMEINLNVTRVYSPFDKQFGG